MRLEHTPLVPFQVAKKGAGMNDFCQVVRTTGLTIVVALMSLAAARAAQAFQIAPLGSQFEAQLTNEPESTLVRVAGKLGKLVKKPVHEEITQLAFDCPIENSLLQDNEECARRDNPFATAFIIYGVRWNDLPPFKLKPNEGKRCKKFLTGVAACNTGQTIRFSTQPECWYCIFTAAESFTGKGGTIAGCPKDKAGGSHIALGNLLTRSHYGDLQFLHSMAVHEGVPPEQTQRQVLSWIEFAWRVSVGDIKPDQRLSGVDIPLVAERFGCSEWTVADLYILGQQDRLLRNIKDVAFGSVLHTVQDSFSSSHTQREASGDPGFCGVGDKYPKASPIKEFHSYGTQDGHRHDEEDQRAAMVSHAIERKTEAIAASRLLVDFYRDMKSWGDVRPYVECLFELKQNASPSSAGDNFRRASGGK